MHMLLANKIKKNIDALFKLFKERKFDQAIKLAEKLIAHGINEAVVHEILAASLVSTNQENRAIKHFRYVVQKNPEYVQGLCNLGTALIAVGQNKEAEKPLKMAIFLQPNSPASYYNLAISYSNTQKIDKAIATYKLALDIAPDNANIINNLSALLNDLRRYDEAINHLTSLIDTGQATAMPFSNRAIAYVHSYRFTEAMADFEQASALGADFNGYYQGLAELLIEQKQYNKASLLLEEGLDKLSYIAEVYSTLLQNQCYSEYLSNETTFDRSYRYGKNAIANVTPQLSSVPNKITYSKRIKVGYISPDFRSHSVAQFFEPLIREHSQDVETYCYYNFYEQDATTSRIKKASDHWRDVHVLSDVELFNQIKKDDICILVDLSGHTTKNRLSVFASQAAPIQISWLGFADTTGLPTITYRIVDPITDPVGQDDQWYTERLYRLPTTFLTYQGNTNVSVKEDIPFFRTGNITFGSFNNLRKVTLDVIDAWCHILNRVKGSKILLKSALFKGEESRQFYQKLFADRGITSDRICLFERTDTSEDHLSLYNEVDLSLDSFPYNGTTTTCEALWMGVPVVTYRGGKHAARVSSSILENVGLSDWVADDIGSYINLAVEMANNPDILRSLRLELREKMQQSPLCDHKRFAADLEAAYQDIVQRHLLENS